MTSLVLFVIYSIASRVSSELYSEDTVEGKPFVNTVSYSPERTSVASPFYTLIKWLVYWFICAPDRTTETETQITQSLCEFQ